MTHPPTATHVKVTISLDARSLWRSVARHHNLSLPGWVRYALAAYPDTMDAPREPMRRGNTERGCVINVPLEPAELAWLDATVARWSYPGRTDVIRSICIPAAEDDLARTPPSAHECVPRFAYTVALPQCYLRDGQSWSRIAGKAATWLYVLATRVEELRRLVDREDDPEASFKLDDLQQLGRNLRLVGKNAGVVPDGDLVPVTVVTAAPLGWLGEQFEPEIAPSELARFAAILVLAAGARLDAKAFLERTIP